MTAPRLGWAHSLSWTLRALVTVGSAHGLGPAGEATQPGLWPAFWLFGNLGRALYQDSTNGFWPFIFDEFVNETDDTTTTKDGPMSTSCYVNQCRAQRIRKNDPSPGYGMHPHQGRGAPEIDIFEVMPGQNVYYYDAEWACKHN